MFGALNSRIEIFATASVKLFFSMTISGVTDITLNRWYQQNDFNCSMTYPHGRSGPASITRRRDNSSQIGKLLRVIDHFSRYAVVVVGFVIVVIFKFFLQQSLTSAILSIVRLTCNSSIGNVPNNAAARIYLTGSFLFVVTIQAIFQGQSASLLTKSVALTNVQTFESLENFEYTIYGDTSHNSYFEELNVRGRVAGLQNFDCELYVLKDDAAACVKDQVVLVNTVKKFGSHLSDPLIPMFIVYIRREDWPLEERFNTIMSRSIEGNILDNIVEKDFELILRKNKFDEKHEDDQRFTFITLKELAFGFAKNPAWATIHKVVFHWQKQRTLFTTSNILCQ